MFESKKTKAKIADLGKRCEALQYQINENQKKAKEDNDKLRCELNETVTNWNHDDWAGWALGPNRIKSRDLLKKIELLMNHLGLEVVTTPEKTEIKKKLSIKDNKIN